MAEIRWIKAATDATEENNEGIRFCLMYIGLKWSMEQSSLIVFPNEAQEPSLCSNRRIQNTGLGRPVA